MSNLQHIVDQLHALRAKHDKVKSQAAEIYRSIQRTETQLIDEMAMQGLRSFKSDEGVGITLASRFSISVTQENSDMVREWLRESLGDDTDYLDEVVSKKRVSQMLREKIEEGEMEEAAVPEFLRLKTSPTVRMTT